MQTADRMMALVLVLALTGPGRAADVTKVPAFDQFLVVPLRIHVVVSPEFPMTNTRISDAEVARSVPAINAIWSKAGILFGLDSIVREPAGQLERFQLLVKMTNGEFPNTDPFAMLLPQQPSRVFDGVHLYIFHELPYNGFYIAAADAALALEKPSLRPVEGGSKDALARVAARFLGEAIGLVPGREDEIGLASGGTNGVGLSAAEIAQVRKVARTVPGVMAVEPLAKVAATAARTKEIEKARRVYTWLVEVPGAGPGAAEAKKQLAALAAARPK